MDILEQSKINVYGWQLDCVGEWWIVSPDGQAQMIVTEENERSAYADALDGIAEAMRECATADEPTPFEDWSLDCNEL